MKKMIMPLAAVLVAGCATTTPDCGCSPCRHEKILPCKACPKTFIYTFCKGLANLRIAGCNSISVNSRRLHFIQNIDKRLLYKFR